MLAVLRKACPGTIFLKDFGSGLGAKWSHLGHFGGTRAFFFAAGCGVVVGVMEPVGPQARIKSGQGSKSIYPASHMIRSSIYIYILCYPGKNMISMDICIEIRLKNAKPLLLLLAFVHIVDHANMNDIGAVAPGFGPLCPNIVLVRATQVARNIKHMFRFDCCSVSSTQAGPLAHG